MKQSRVQNYIVAVECCPSRQPLQDEEILNNGESSVLYEAIQTRSVKLHSAITRDTCEDLLHRACTFSSIAWAACAKPTITRRKSYKTLQEKTMQKVDKRQPIVDTISTRKCSSRHIKSKEGMHHKWNDHRDRWYK